MELKMGNNKYTFWKLLDENSIEIPIIQRDYAQGRAEESRIRDKFLAAIYKQLTKNDNLPMNLDFVYGRIIDKKLIPLDGQQRLTTLFLLHWYLAVKDKKLADEVIAKLQKFTYETRVSSREFCKALVANKIDLTKEKISEDIEDKNWFFKSWKKDPTIKSMLNMLDAIHNKFKDGECCLFEKLIHNEPPITFDFLPLNDFNLSDELYIKMNARGKPLTHFENFKSNFVELLEPEIALKLDNEWTDLLWSFKGNKKEDGYYYIDDKFLNFFTNFIVNLGINLDMLTEKKDLKDIDIMDVYQIILGKAPNENLTILINTINKLSHLNKQNIKISYFEVFIEKKDISYWDRAKFHSLAMYLIKNETIDFESDKYKDWERITENIIDNFNIDSLKKFQDTLKLISAMSEHIDKLYEYLASDEFLSTAKQSMGHRNLEFQQKEEQLKAKLIFENNKWKKVIVDSELKTKNSYLNGHIGFLIEIADNDINQFMKIFQRFNEVFKEDKEKFLFQRALLSKGDYLIGEVSEWKNRTFCSFETSQRAKDDNWKQVFHYKREILKALLNDESTLQKVIDDFKDKDDFRYGFIKNSEILKYCQQYQIRMASEHDILLLTKERTSGLHAEYCTYWLYLEIKKNDINIKAEYKDQSSIESSKYIYLDDNKIKITHERYDDIWQYKKESNDEYEYFEDRNELINSLIDEYNNDPL
jgi:ribosomal protein L17